MLGHQGIEDEREVEEEFEPAPPRREAPRIFRPLLSVGRAIRDWWRDLLVLSLASLAWAALSLTIVGGPPAGAALFTTARATILHENPDTRLFLAALRVYFGRSWLLGAVGIAGLVIWAFDLDFYNSTFGQEGLLGPLGFIFIFYVGVVWLQTISYAWALLVSRNDLRLLQQLRNGALIALRYPFHNLISTLFIGALFALGIYFPPLYVLVIPPLVALLALHNTYLLAPELVPEDSEALSIVS